MVFIAYNHDGYVVSIVNAKSEDLAKAYWQGAHVNYDSIRNLDDKETFTPLSEHPTGVYPILKTNTVISDSCKRGSKLLCISK